MNFRMIKINSQITYWYEINISSGWDCLGWVSVFFLPHLNAKVILRWNVMVSLILKEEQI